MNSKQLYHLEVVDITQDTDDYLSIFFIKPKEFTFIAGACFDLSFIEKDFQESRIFSFSSSPTEKLLRVTFKKGISEYKKRLEKVKKGDTLGLYYYGNQYPFHLDRPLIFYAGGIGIAVFRSVIKQAIDMRLTPSFTLLYSNSTEHFPFKEELDEWAGVIGMPTLYIETKKQGRLDREKIEAFLDITSAPYEHYIIGPPLMVDDTASILMSMQVDPKTIHIDSFDGYSE